MKKFLLLALALAMVLTLAACGSSKIDPQGTRLGNSAFSIVLPAGYEMAEDDFDEDQIAYCYKDDESIDFDIYLWAKEGIYTLEDEAAYFAAEYGTVAEPVEINGIGGMKYVSLEDHDGYTYTVVNYMFEDEENIVELCFWTIDTAEEYAAVDEIINTLKMD